MSDDVSRDPASVPHPTGAPTPPAPDVATDPSGGRAAVFFDLDKTLVAGSSGFYWARAAAATGLISRRRLAADGWANVRFRLSGSTDESTRAVWERAGAFIAGKRVRDFERLSPRVLAGLLPRLYPQMLAIAWQHQDEGRPVYIVTASTQETADMVAHVVAFDGGIGAPLEQVDGRYTGRLAGPMTYREGKVEAIAALAAAEGYDLAASWAYSDSESDLPMLRAVGHPVAVNPDRELARVAREEGWEVIRLERITQHLKAVAALAVLGAAGGLARVAVADRTPAAGRVRRAR
ncbi:HAD family phosphatase [Patulibacter sp.]|uniref:HAD family hydrolase n=1 Tax=Patulibacter sp. TaxID=1912859 RepID=UPI00271BCED2|nr:HAD-IB family hydrolase [Patulibacter sp.]MDO9408526.1 HAD-IB family hydrolase [Patulibacter sp.]